MLSQPTERPAGGQLHGAHSGRRDRRRAPGDRADQYGPQVAWLGAWTPPLGISLVADRLSALMLLVSAVVTLAVLSYSVGQGMTGDERETPVSIYHPTFLVLVAGVSNAFLAGDLFNLFVSFEMLLFASYVLLTLGGTATRIRAGTIYVVVNMLSSSLFLISIAAVYAATGSLNLAQLAERIRDLPDAVSLILQLLLLVTFSVKAAVFPLSLWLPDSYPTAPAPVTAVFAGLLTKVGVYAILRMQTLLFPDSPLTDLLLWAALVTMVVGILGRRRAVRHQADALVHPGQPHRLHDLRHRPRDRGRDTPERCSTSPTTSRSRPHFPGRRPHRTPRRQHGPAPARRPGQARPGAGRPVLRARHEPRRDPAHVRVPRQGRPAAGRPRRRQSAGHHAGGRRAWQPAC